MRNGHFPWTRYALLALATLALVLIGTGPSDAVRDMQLAAIALAAVAAVAGMSVPRQD